MHGYRTLPGGDKKHRASHWSRPLPLRYGFEGANLEEK